MLQMINKIIDGIIAAIVSEFGEGYEIYTESVEQGFEEPSFSILCLNPTINQKLGKRYFRTNQFCIYYFPESAEKRTECHAVAERLIGALELITVDGDLCRGTEIHHEVVDDVLSFFVNYDMFVIKAQDTETAMESLSQKTDMKG
jgi:hypothetical protein